MDECKKEKMGGESVRICKKCLLEKTIDRFRDNNKACRKCNNINSKVWAKKWRENPNNKEKIAEYRKNKDYKQYESYRRNKKIQRAKAKIKDRAILHRRYIYTQLRNKGFKAEDITPELIDTQRLIIKTKRLCKTLKNSETA